MTQSFEPRTPFAAMPPVEETRGFENLYYTPLPSGRTGALYNAFPYPTKISPEAIAVFIACHTEPGDTILDVFAGSGTTGLATLLCDRPTQRMKAIATELGQLPKWGPRHAELYELGALGAFISNTMCTPPDPHEFEKAAHQLIKRTKVLLKDIYQARDPDGNDGEIRHIIWSDVFICPNCSLESRFWDTSVRYDPLKVTKDFVCVHCNHVSTVDDVERVTEEVFDPLLKRTIRVKKRVPVRVYGATAGKTWQRSAETGDESLLKSIEAIAIPKAVPLVEVEWGELHRAGYHLGISHIHHFYTRRNLLAIAFLWQEISSFPLHLQDALKLLVLSYNATHSTLMSRVVVKNGEGDFVLTGAQSGVLYISSLPVEKNVFDGITRKTTTFKQAFDSIYGSNSTVRTTHASSTRLDLPDESIDYVFTDPPFGDYIPYAEINQLNEAWLGNLTDRREEIIISPSQGKNTDQYGELMHQVFAEVARVLKAKGKMTLVFHSAKASVWRALVKSYTEAGLSVKLSSVLDKLQSSFKQVVSNGSVKGDPLLLLVKNTEDRIPPKHIVSDEEATVIKDILYRMTKDEPKSVERTAQRLYSRYISRCLELDLVVSMNANEFYELVRNNGNGRNST